ncbi:MULTISPECIES: phage major tail tube protein [Dickeya]|uniref:Phage major tail tube protein n=3 Tax=Dickeya TaxID=204037 RepID=A0AAX1C561_9GAMM|nr:MULTISPECIES: phage major tail tube protein [Dickeya]ATO31591.1 Phage major tail tube protein [Dickeya dianthicola RNS04.9]MBP2844064.1 phage major tail tube protein [Dickeya oryzae]MBP2850520.1 phage major tail tube protein [Dickeya oryzae]MBT1430970.1 phage major tail tube protein [Dickeya dianthicola]MCA6995779.1 phage major tail tube protein [Dickeya oryzae]
MALPRTLKYLNLFNDGNNFMGVVESFTPPKLTRKLEKFRGGGMSGTVDIDMGLDDGALECEWQIGGWEPLIFKQLGTAKADGVQLRFTGSIQRDDTGEVQAVEIVLRGRHKEVDSGEAKQGEKTTTKISTVCTYYKLTINGDVLVEIDILNMIENIGGEDRLAEHRSAIGL